MSQYKKLEVNTVQVLNSNKIVLKSNETTHVCSFRIIYIYIGYNISNVKNNGFFYCFGNLLSTKWLLDKNLQALKRYYKH